MNSFDYLLVVIVGLSCGLALIRGFAREAAGILGWLAGFALAVYLASEASDYVTGEVFSIDGGALASGYAPTGYAPVVTI